MLEEAVKVGDKEADKDDEENRGELDRCDVILKDTGDRNFDSRNPTLNHKCCLLPGTYAGEVVRYDIVPDK